MLVYGLILDLVIDIFNPQNLLQHATRIEVISFYYWCPPYTLQFDVQECPTQAISNIDG